MALKFSETLFKLNGSGCEKVRKKREKSEEIGAYNSLVLARLLDAHSFK
jgi:hypothetical protein